MFSPLNSKEPSPSESLAADNLNTGSLVERFIYVENWRNKRFIIWAMATPCALFGYFVPFVHLVSNCIYLVISTYYDIWL